MTGNAVVETRAILDFWLEEIGPERWWTRSDETDAAIRARFGALWEEWRQRTPESFLGSAEEALAGILLFDQFSRNLHRDSAEAFATDPLALAIARGAVERGLDDQVAAAARAFFYMPFQHSERLADQDRALALFTALGDARSIEFSHKHRDIIARFGRFPHRNTVLGRADRPGEAEAAREGAAW